MYITHKIAQSHKTLDHTWNPYSILTNYTDGLFSKVWSNKIKTKK